MDTNVVGKKISPPGIVKVKIMQIFFLKFMVIKIASKIMILTHNLYQCNDLVFDLNYVYYQNSMNCFKCSMVLKYTIYYVISPGA